MKKILISIVAGFALSSLLLAQTTAPAPNQGNPPQPAAPSQPTQPQQQPPAAGQSGTPGAQQQPPTAGQQQQPPSAGPQAKSKEEYDAYTAVASETDPAKAEQAVAAFEQKFPESELKAPLYQQLMAKYQMANNADKTLEYGRKVLQTAPDSPVALITVASVIAERTRETDIDAEQKFAEGRKNAERAIQLIDTRAWAPPQITPQQLDMVKSMAYVAIGAIELTKGNDPVAEQALRRAVELNMIQPEAVTFLRLALALDRQKKYSDALVAANRAVELSGNEPAIREKAIQEQNRLKQLTGPQLEAAPSPGAPKTGGTSAAPPQPPRQQPPR